MYKLLLIRKYLLKRRIAWVALLAVMLCTAMVLVVLSVMGGWLEMFKSAYRGMTSDIVVEARSLVGFPYYQEMMDRIDKLPEVEATVPVIRTFGLINIADEKRKPVSVIGFPIDQIGRVSDFPKSLYRQFQVDHDATPSFDLLPKVDYKYWAGKRAKDDVFKRPGLIITDPVADIEKDEAPPKAMYELPTTLTLVPVTPGESVRAEDAGSYPFWIVDNARSRIWQLDSNDVYASFDELQKDLRMTPFDDEPARTSEIDVKVKPGFDLMPVRDKIDQIVQEVSAERQIPDYYPIRIATWEQMQGKFIDAVEHEVVLTTALFGVISMVSVLLIFCIFYMIVLEKTKDIGIIKSVGATAGGVLQLFLGYGLAIGVVGSGLGLLLAYLVVHNINWLHAELTKWMGITIWDPETYQFAIIPNKMDPRNVVWILGIAILSAILGAMLPAIRAARMNPVESLRYE